MRKLSLLCLSGLLLLSINALAAPIDKLVVFGDSLSDNGNTYQLTYYYNHGRADLTVPRSPPYFQGHFSNGPVWVEDLAVRLFGKTPAVSKLLDWAYGGSWVEGSSASGQRFLPDLYQQIYLYEKTSFDFYPQNHLFIIWDGANDYLVGRKDPDAATTAVVKVIHDAIERLYKDGARRILLPLMPDFAVTPYGQTTQADFQQGLSRLATLHNQKLVKAITQLRQAHTDLQLITFDTQQFFDVLKTTHHLNSFSLPDTTTPCLTALAPHRTRRFATPLLASMQTRVALLANTADEPQPLVCADPQNHFFWDSVHPTATAHEIMAIEIAKLLAKQNY